MEGSWGEESMLVPDQETAIAVLEDEVRAGDIVLVKASQSGAMWTVADALLAGSAVDAVTSDSPEGEQ
jgi:UDP-N-acetylmuramoyl-tripeptide--D-alanyl-D-alanine ligase